MYASMDTFGSAGDNRSRRPGMERIALGLIAVLMLPAVHQAAFAPRSFFDDFPLGRSWIVDQVGLIGSLVMIPVLALVAMWAGRSSPEAVE